MVGKTWSLAPRIYNLIRETSPFYGKDVIKNQCILELNMRQEKAWCGRTRIGLEQPVDLVSGSDFTINSLCGLDK